MAQSTADAPDGVRSSDTDEEVLERLRKAHRDPTSDHKHPANVTHYESAGFGDQLADQLSAAMGSWPFIIAQSCLLLFWTYLNVWAVFVAHWDPYPFILLNL